VEAEPITDEIDVHEFIWAFLQVIDHDREEELFIVSAIMELYEYIKEQIKDLPMIWEHVTSSIITLMHELEFQSSTSAGVGRL
jgi:archaellum component FlaC